MVLIHMIYNAISNIYNIQYVLYIYNILYVIYLVLQLYVFVNSNFLYVFIVPLFVGFGQSSTCI